MLASREGYLTALNRKEGPLADDELEKIDKRCIVFQELNTVLRGNDNPHEKLEKSREILARLETTIRENPLETELETPFLKFIRSVKKVLHISHNFGLFQTDADKFLQQSKNIITLERKP